MVLCCLWGTVRKQGAGLLNHLWCRHNCRSCRDVTKAMRVNRFAEHFLGKGGDRVGNACGDHRGMTLADPQLVAVRTRQQNRPDMLKVILQMPMHHWRNRHHDLAGSLCLVGWNLDKPVVPYPSQVTAERQPCKIVA